MHVFHHLSSFLQGSTRGVCKRIGWLGVRGVVAVSAQDTILSGASLQFSKGTVEVD